MFQVGIKTLVDTMAARLTVVKVETVGYTKAKVKYRPALKTLSAMLATVEFDTTNQAVV